LTCPSKKVTILKIGTFKKDTMNKELITVTEYTKQLSQEEDTCGRSGHEYQYLNLKTMDNGAGYYLVFDTERWAVDDREEWIKLWDKHIEPMLKELNEK
jgi:hypothetical protein